MGLPETYFRYFMAQQQIGKATNIHAFLNALLVDVQKYHHEDSIMVRANGANVKNCLLQAKESDNERDGIIEDEDILYNG